MAKMIRASEGSKVGSLKRRVWRQLFSTVARSAQNTVCFDQFLKFRCRKIAWCCGLPKHIFKSKCAKYPKSGARFEVQMFSAMAQNIFVRQKIQDTACFDHFLKFRCPKNCRMLWREGYFQVKHRRGTSLLKGQMSKNCTLLQHQVHLKVKMLKN